MKSRLVILFLLFVGLWVALAVRGTSLKLFPGDKLTNLQKKQFERSLKVRSRRGAIVDRNGNELAVSMASYSLFGDPKIIEDKVQVARKLAKILKVPSSKIYKQIQSKKRRFSWISRNLDKLQKQKIQDLKVYGLGFIEEPMRVYPNDSLLAQVMGFVGREGYGLEGLELKFDDYLRGKEKRLMVQRDARGRPLINEASQIFDTTNGSDLLLTIDREVQFFLEKELAKAIRENEAKRAVGVVLDAKTSEVIAMATGPSFNLNLGKRYSAGIRRNRVVADAFEPGSTLKTFVIAAGLKNKLIKPSSKFDCEGGRMKVGRRTIREADATHNFGMLTVSEILAKSSNVGSAKIGFNVGDRKFFETLAEFGFGQKTEISLPGESQGILQGLPWNKHLLSNISFGHGVATTPLQIANAYAAIANKGQLNIPKIIRGVRNSVDGSVEKVEKVGDTREVLSERQAETLTLMLTQATSDEGTGSAARVPGYPVAGKTGTAQKVDVKNGGYIPDEYISSFAGFLPAHDPRFVIYVAVDTPKENYYGSQVAAPIFSRVGGYLMRKEGVPPVLISQKNVIPKKRARKRKQDRAIDKMTRDHGAGLLPDLVGLSLREALQSLRGHTDKVKINGKGRVVKMTPSPGLPIEAGQPVYLKLKPLSTE